MNKKVVAILCLAVGLGLLVGLSGCFPDIDSLLEEADWRSTQTEQARIEALQQTNEEAYRLSHGQHAGEQQAGDQQPAEPPAQADPEPETIPDPQADPDPDPEAPVGPVVKHVWFKQEDCTVPAVSGLKAEYGPGVLECNYRWAGDLIDDNRVTIEIYEILDPDELSEKLNQGMRDSRTSANDFTEQTLTTLQDDGDGYYFVSTFEGGFSADANAKEPLCARANGYALRNERFLVHLGWSMCDFGDATNESFVAFGKSVDGVAQAAIDRAVAEEK